MVTVCQYSPILPSQVSENSHRISSLGMCYTSCFGIFVLTSSKFFRKLLCCVPLHHFEQWQGAPSRVVPFQGHQARDSARSQPLTWHPSCHSAVAKPTLTPASSFAFRTIPTMNSSCAIQPSPVFSISVVIYRKMWGSLSIDLSSIYL